MFSIIQAAGWPIWPLIACSIAALALIIERFLSLRTRRVVPPQLLDEALAVSRHALPPPEVVNQLEQNCALGEVLASGLRALASDPRSSEAQLRAVMEASGRAVAHRLERYLSALGTIASAGPLLGLFGTVVGMIITFQVITEQGAGDPRLMAAGISQAMIATVLGLGIAVPLLFVNSLLAARSRVLLQILDEQSTGLLAERLERSRA